MVNPTNQPNHKVNKTKTLKKVGNFSVNFLSMMLQEQELLMIQQSSTRLRRIIGHVFGDYTMPYVRVFGHLRLICVAAWP